MVIFKKSNNVSFFIEEAKSKGKSVGFVPTMGALHDGHLSLLRLSKQENEITICSIFVNPTQFNNVDDYTFYPITIEKDIQKLVEAGCDAIFLPSISEIYPPDYQKKHYNLGKIETILEGYYRPGHFQGVCQVVDQLLSIVQPNKLYLGQKDYQQCMVIQKLLQLTGRNNVELKIGSTLREEDGLAMSSRNLRLSSEARLKSIEIYDALQFIKQNISSLPLTDIKAKAQQQLEKEGFVVDYIEIANAQTLEPVNSTNQPLVALIAASINNIRLIDNMPLN